MELQFDKEIDAILRKAGARASNSASADHVDADGLSAFVENALPAAARRLYTSHFADCDACRRKFALAISAHPEDPPASAVVHDIGQTQAKIPWYTALRSTRGLALSMGALVLVFSGLLGFMVIQNRDSGVNSTISQVTEQERQTSTAPIEPLANTAGSNEEAKAITAAPPNEGALAKGAFVAQAANSAPSAGNSTGTAMAPAQRNDLRAEDRAPVAASPPPPPPVAVDATRADDDRRKTENKAKEEERVESASNLTLAKPSGERARREVPGAAAKQAPLRSGPAQVQSQINTQTFEMPVTRNVGGRTFNNRQGAWYDSGYQGQATTNVRRGTDEYKKLPAAVRNIADTLGGIVVIVMGGKAYRIN